MTVLERDHPAHWHHAMQKNSSSTETVQRYLRKVLHFHRQNLMLIRPPNDQATACGTYGKYATEYFKGARDVPRNVCRHYLGVMQVM